MANEIVSRAEAKAKGLKRYFTGLPCKHGHISERQTTNGLCVVCRGIIGTRWVKRNPEKVREKVRLQAARYQRDNPDRIRRNKRNWELRNPDKVRAKERRWIAANPERKRSHGKKWRAANKDKIKAKNQKYKTLHADRLKPINLARVKQWRKNNSDKVRLNARKASHARRARQHRSGGSYTNNQIADLLIKQKYLCAACDVSITEARELDHIIAIANGGPNHIGNLQWLCPPCNRSKGAKDYALWTQEKHTEGYFNRRIS